MFLWVRKFCVTVLALALLAAPCLSTIDMFKGGPAHAHHGLGAQHVSGTQSAGHSHHSVHGGHVHKHNHATVLLAGDQPVDPGGNLASCCRLCDGWLTKKASDDGKVVERAAPTPDRENGKILVTATFVPPSLYRHERLCAYLAALDPEPASLPVYALTQRFRI